MGTTFFEQVPRLRQPAYSEQTTVALCCADDMNTQHTPDCPPDCRPMDQPDCLDCEATRKLQRYDEDEAEVRCATCIGDVYREADWLKAIRFGAENWGVLV